MELAKIKPGKEKISSRLIFFFGCIMSSFGILLVTVGGSWDITNHLLNKPETFFSPPHALLYTGVAIALLGLITSFFSWRRLHNQTNIFNISLKFQSLGIALLIGAGPFDFVWHSNFGLDGLLSPPHFTLISGMILCGIGGMLGITRFIETNFSHSKFSQFLHVLAILPVWLACSGFISSLSLPFSNTDYFDFNPEPLLAVIIATSAYPFLISISMMMSSIFSHYRFGIQTVLGVLFLLIYSSTAIIPNFALLDSIEFYTLNIIPFVISDLIVTIYKSRISLIISGGILGSVFYMVYYPYVMYTFNEVLLGQLVSPSMIYHIYFEIIQDTIVFTIIPSILLGMFGGYFAFKISKQIMKKSLTSNNL